ncbi:MAG: hypothetical protein ACXADH_00500 [Candidatus Kariarchaeaceae archaeon]|jgi:hypothetical protein
MKDKNIGKEGYDSIRINGSKIDNLPLGQGEKAKEGLSDFLQTDRQTKISNIKAKYPKVSEDYIHGTLKELNTNIKRVKNLKKEMAAKIDEYTSLITQSQVREAKIEQLDKDKPDDAKKIKELYKQYPPYKVEALRDQITQFKESIERCDLVIEQEYESIAEFTKNLALVKQRDTELKAVMK